jgi:hypothetical protein
MSTLIDLNRALQRAEDLARRLTEEQPGAEAERLLAAVAACERVSFALGNSQEPTG